MANISSSGMLLRSSSALAFGRLGKVKRPRTDKERAVDKSRSTKQMTAAAKAKRKAVQGKFQKTVRPQDKPVPKKGFTRPQFRRVFGGGSTMSTKISTGVANPVTRRR